MRERQQTARLLEAVARVARPQPKPWLSPAPVRNAMLGLPEAVHACIFDLERVLTDSAAAHAWAWGEVFDDFLLRSSQQTGWHFIPFDRVADYRSYLDGRPRLEGVHAFLRSRGIRLPEGPDRRLTGDGNGEWLGQPKGRDAGEEAQRARRNRFSRSSALPRGRPSCRRQMRSDLGERKHVQGARALRARRAHRRTHRRRGHAIRAACVRFPRRMCCSPRVADSKCFPLRPRPLPAARPESQRDARRVSRSSASGTPTTPSSWRASARSGSCRHCVRCSIRGSSIQGNGSTDGDSARGPRDP